VVLECGGWQPRVGEERGNSQINSDPPDSPSERNRKEGGGCSVPLVLEHNHPRIMKSVSSIHRPGGREGVGGENNVVFSRRSLSLI